jgi:alkylation response protein AidB-like acyl-CoA dehydrogenase
VTAGPSESTAGELAMLRDLVRRFVEDELIPLEPAVMERGLRYGATAAPLIPPDAHARLISRCRELDLFGIDVPPELGGHGYGATFKIVALEELRRSIVPFVLPPDSPSLHMMIAACDQAQRDKYLRPYARGDKRSSFALTEPEAGSDAAAIRTSAVQADGGWLLNGSKLWIGAADVADFFIVIAVTDRQKRAHGGISAFLVDQGTPGLDLGPPQFHMGDIPVFQVFLRDCWIPDGQLLGQPGQAFVLLANRLGLRRVEIGAHCVGMARRLLELMVDQALRRSTFGQPLASRQAVQWWIADTEIEIAAARQLVYAAAAKLDAGVTDIRREAAMAKIYATEMITRVADRAVQLYGGMGFSRELPIEWIYRNSRIYRVADGASEILRREVARGLLGDVAK